MKIHGYPNLRAAVRDTVQKSSRVPLLWADTDKAAVAVIKLVREYDRRRAKRAKP